MASCPDHPARGTMARGLSVAACTLTVRPTVPRIRHTDIQLNHVRLLTWTSRDAVEVSVHQASYASSGMACYHSRKIWPDCLGRWSVLSSGEEIFNRLQRRADKAEVSREAAAADRLMRWQRATLEVLPRYRETAPMLSNDCEHLMTRITFMRPKLIGVLKKRQARNESKIPQWEEGEHTAGWFILSRVDETYERGDRVTHEFALFLLHDGQFLETSDSFHQLIDAGVLSKGELSGGAITAYPRGTGHLNWGAAFLDDLSLADLYLRPSLASFDGGASLSSSRINDSDRRSGASRFEASFARLFHAAGREMPGNLHLPEG